MTVIILLLVLAGICGFGYHFFFGQSLASLFFYLIGSVGGAVVGFTFAKLLGLDWLTVGGLPVLTTLVGSLLFLTLLQRLRLT